MPITENGFEYTIPDQYKEMITKSFLQTLKYELKIIFPQSAHDLDNEEPWIYLSSTGGWYDAFIKATKLHKLDRLAEYYDSLPWYDSDMFDSDVIDLALLYNVIDPMTMPTFPQIVWARINERWILRYYHFEKFVDWVKLLFKKKKKIRAKASGWTIDDK